MPPEESPGADKPLMLDNLLALAQLLHLNHQVLFDHHTSIRAGALYCARCGDRRRMEVLLLLSPLRHGQPRSGLPVEESPTALNSVYVKRLIPSVFRYTCMQCEAALTAVIYLGTSGPALLVLPQEAGGIRTPHTPAGISYYLDQAQRARSVGAYSAAAAMYRAALEHLMHEQGYTEGMLGKRIAKLEEAIAEGKAPKWAVGLETEFLKILNRLANGAIHAGTGDVAKQETFDTELMDDIQETFSHILFLVYEVPHEKQQRLSRLSSKAQMLKK